MIEFDIPSMSCGHCVGRVTQAVKSADPAATVEVDLQTKKVKVRSSADREVVSAALSEAGYAPK